MKLTRPVAAGAALALSALVVLGISAAGASAATPDVTYLTSADIPASTYPFQAATGWFTSVGGTQSSGLTGLALTSKALVYEVATPQPVTTGTALEDLASTMSVQSDATATLSPSIYVYVADPATNPTAWTFTTADHGADIADPTTQWYSPGPIGTIAGGTKATLAQFDAQLAVDPVFAHAVVTCAGWDTALSSTAHIYSASAEGTHDVFTPEPVVSAAPTTISFADYTKAPGVTISTTGFLPGEVVDVYYGTPNGGGQIGTVTADANGAVTYSHFDAAATTGGAYSLTLVGETATGNPQRFDFTVGDPIVVAAAAPTLAATGVDATPYLLVAGVLLVLGVALVLVMALRRRGRHS